MLLASLTQTRTLKRELSDEKLCEALLSAELELSVEALGDIHQLALQVSMKEGECLVLLDVFEHLHFEAREGCTRRLASL